MVHEQVAVDIVWNRLKAATWELPANNALSVELDSDIRLIHSSGLIVMNPRIRDQWSNLT